MRRVDSGASDKILQSRVIDAMGGGLFVRHEHGDQHNALAGTDFDGLMGWIDNYCSANPLNPIATPAYALMQELRSRAH